MFERFTERARQVVVLAQQEARTLTHNYLGSEHLLLGLLGEAEGLAAQTLTDAGVTLEAARERMPSYGSPEEYAPGQQLPLTPKAKKILEGSLREALSLGHNYIGTEHILLSLLRVEESTGARMVADFSVTAEAIRDRVITALGPRNTGKRPSPPADAKKPPVVPMQGWECPRCHTIHSPYTASCRCAAARTNPRAA